MWPSYNSIKLYYDQNIYLNQLFVGWSLGIDLKELSICDPLLMITYRIDLKKHQKNLYSSTCTDLKVPLIYGPYLRINHYIDLKAHQIPLIICLHWSQRAIRDHLIYKSQSTPNPLFSYTNIKTSLIHSL